MKSTMLARLRQAVVKLAWAIPSGAAIFFGQFLIDACICFFTLGHLETLNVFINGAWEYVEYPFGIYGKPVLVIFTFLVPLGPGPALAAAIPL